MLHPAVLKSRQQKKRLVGFHIFLSFTFLTMGDEFDNFFQWGMNKEPFLKYHRHGAILMHFKRIQLSPISEGNWGRKLYTSIEKTTPQGHIVHLSSTRWRCLGWWWRSSWCAGRPTTSTSSSPFTSLISPARSGSQMSTWRWAYLNLSPTYGIRQFRKKNAKIAKICFWQWGFYKN